MYRFQHRDCIYCNVSTHDRTGQPVTVQARMYMLNFINKLKIAGKMQLFCFAAGIMHGRPSGFPVVGYFNVAFFTIDKCFVNSINLLGNFTDDENASLCGQINNTLCISA